MSFYKAKDNQNQWVEKGHKPCKSLPQFSIQKYHHYCEIKLDLHLEKNQLDAVKDEKYK